MIENMLNIPILTSEAIPPDSVALVQVKQTRPVTPKEREAIYFGTEEQRRAVLDSAFRVSGAMLTGLALPPCPFQLLRFTSSSRCQLSAGHGEEHCCNDPRTERRYLMCDDNGNILREL